MTSIEGRSPEPNGRWAVAVRRAQGVEDNGLGEAVKTYFTRYFPVGFFVLVTAGTAAGVLGFGGTWADWASYLIFGMFLAVIGGLVGGLVFNARKVVPAAKFGRVDVLLSLEDEERKHVRRQIAGKARVDLEHLSVVRAAAVQQRKGLATQLLVMPFLPMSLLAQVVRLYGPISWLMAVGMAVVALAIAFLIRDFRRAGRFLARTAERASSGNASG